MRSCVIAGSFFLLFDDIATILDDVSTMTALATKKTAGVLGDDLALNAQQMIGIDADRELPVVWQVAKGSWKNKLILVPSALAISYFFPLAVKPLLMIGGLYLCYEGVEKLAHKFLHSQEEDETHRDELIKAIADPKIDMVEVEKEKIRGAVRTDFVLSAEIITLSLATVATESFLIQILVLIAVAVLMTVGVYGLVAAIVKLDDGGRYLSLRPGESKWPTFQRSLGRGIIAMAPYLLRGLSVAGTIAMFVVGGGIVTHGIPPLHDWVHHLSEQVASIPRVGWPLGFLLGPVVDGIVGIIAGILVLIVVQAIKSLIKRAQTASSESRPN